MQIFYSMPTINRVPFKNLADAEMDISRDLRRILRADILAPGTFYGLLSYFAFRRLSSELSFDDYYLTFEGNPWEKTSIAALRKLNPNILVTGCQHTVVPQASTGVFVGKGESDILEYPDRIITVGNTPREIILKYGELPHETVIPGCALRYTYLQEIKPETGALPKTLLLALEGVIHTTKLLNYLAKFIDSLGEWKVIVRFHPALPFAEIDASGAFPEVLRGKVELSTRSLLDDLSDSGAVLYWGSTVALEAIQLGVPAIHLKGEEILSYDPLFACEALHETLLETDSLPVLLDQMAQMDSDELERSRHLAKAFMADYFLPVTDERLALFLAPRD